ncbi:probable WRKY transcription factor 54 isoform X2 [Cajanus cajan]|uniref:probable WRKY transcription factor 54 isoform X2 n=1 Tax=Cajanus cajan TaxID=3821 RepID=UPI0010FB4F55|nr:probable WRKY transcription factor 54 isoform X2 [Cajanus cajan]
MFLESESMIIVKERVIMEELVKGQEAATQLKGLLENPIGSEDFLSPEQLLENVLSSFSQTISIIKASSFQPPPPVPAPAPAPAPHVLGSASYSTSGDDSVNWNRSQQGQSDERDSHSIRKGKGAQTWTAVLKTTDDGHVWRKYGEKQILNSKFLRNDESLHEGSDLEMQNRENDSLYSQFRGKQKIIDYESSWSLLTLSSDRNTDTTLSNSHDYSGPS